MKKQSLKRVPALLLALILTVSLLPFSALAVEGYITVHVTVENLTYSPAAGEAGEGMTGIPLSADISVPAGSTMLSGILTALGNAGLSYTESGGYISAIGGLAAGSAGGWDGWSAALNNVLPGVGLGYVYLNDGDSVRVLYTDSYGGVDGYDGVTWSSYNDAHDGFSFSTGVFSYLPGSYGTDLTLTLPADATELQVTGVPHEEGESVRIYTYSSALYTMGETVYGLGDAIGLDGSFDTLTVAVGDAAASTYGVKLRMVSDVSAETLRSHIASAYVQDASDYWHVLGVQAFRTEGFAYEEAVCQSYVNAAVDALMSATSSSNAAGLAMHLMALQALGYDPSLLTDIYGNTANGYEILANAQVYSVEGSAYSLMAWLNAGDTVYDAEIVAAIGTLEAAQTDEGYWDGGWGYYADTTSVALMALSMANDREITDGDGVFSKAYPVADGVIAKAAAYLESQILADGSVPGDNNGTAGNANTTAMTVMALKAAGIEPSEVTGTESTNTLLQGLLLFAVADESGFVYSSSYGNTYNDAATKQAFLALIAAAAPGESYNCLDFTDMEAAAPAAAVAAGCPVTFSGTPADAAVTVKLEDTVQTAQSTGKYDLAAGFYTYTLSKNGYVTKTGSFAVSAEDADSHAPRTVSYAMSLVPATEYIYVTVKGPDGTLYRNRAMEWVSGMTPLSALMNTGLSVKTDGAGSYVVSIGGISEFDYGGNSGWCYEVNGDAGILEASDEYLLSADDELVWYYTVDYTQEDEGGIWTVPTVPVIQPEAEPAPLTYTDVSEEDWFCAAVRWTTEAGLFKGVTETAFQPDGAMTRGMLATILWRYAGAGEAQTGAGAFLDVADGAWYAQAVCWASENSIMGGYGNGLFGSGDALANEQLAAVLWRYAGSPPAGDIGSVEGVSAWAADAVRWAAENGLLTRGDGVQLAPAEGTTRAEAADMLMRFAQLMEASDSD